MRPRVACVAGHSLGEFSALTAAGALSFEDGLRLVRRRGEAMREAGPAAPGGMAAILGLSDESVAEMVAQASAREPRLGRQLQRPRPGGHRRLRRRVGARCRAGQGARGQRVPCPWR